MTNKEVVQELKSRKLTMSMCIDIESCRSANNAIDIAINSIQENTKLKAEIEELKSKLEQSVKLQEVLLRATWGSEWSRCYMCDNSMKNITLDGKNNGCDGSCYHSAKYTKEDLLDKIKREIDRTERIGAK